MKRIVLVSGGMIFGRITRFLLLSRVSCGRCEKLMMVAGIEVFKEGVWWGTYYGVDGYC